MPAKPERKQSAPKVAGTQSAVSGGKAPSKPSTGPAPKRPQPHSPAKDPAKPEANAKAPTRNKADQPKPPSKTATAVGKGAETAVSSVASPVVGKVAGKVAERFVGSKAFKLAVLANIGVALMVVSLVLSPLVVFIGDQQVAAEKVRRSALAAKGDGMPSGVLGAYMSAGRAEAMPWQVIASIAFQQTDHGRSAGDGAVRFGSGAGTGPGGIGSTPQTLPSTHGRISYFGSTDECQGMALWQSLGSTASCDMDQDATLRYYVAMRWQPYTGGAYAWWRQQRIKITLPRTGKSVVVVPGDWGPASWTGRDFDVSLPAYEALGAKTDDIVDAVIVDPSTPTGPTDGPGVPGAPAPTGLASDELGERTSLYPSVEPPIELGEAPDTWAGPMLIPAAKLDSEKANETATAARWVADELNTARRALGYRETLSFEAQRDIWIAALEKLPLKNVSVTWAGQVYSRALAWINGESSTCAATPTGGTAAPTTSSSTTTASSSSTTTTSSSPGSAPQTGGIQVGSKLSDGTSVTAEMITNAQLVINAGVAANVPKEGQVIAIATTLVESGLVNLDHGDRDSVGLFQQRPSQGWGTVDQIMDPTYAAGKFYEALLQVGGWASMQPGDAAQAVQRSAFPDRYAERIGDATSIVASVTAAPVTTANCPASGAITINTPGGPVNVVNVPTPEGGVIDIAAELAPHLAALLEAADRDGIKLGGGGFRDPNEQIALRKQNCGSSQYAIYEMPSSSCSPPTAKPGSSQHERGLAIDFTYGGKTICFKRPSSACSNNAGFDWLVANASKYGLYNLPSESWHWSTTGR